MGEGVASTAEIKRKGREDADASSLAQTRAVGKALKLYFGAPNYAILNQPEEDETLDDIEEEEVERKPKSDRIHAFLSSFEDDVDEEEIEKMVKPEGIDPKEFEEENEFF